MTYLAIIERASGAVCFAEDADGFDPATYEIMPAPDDFRMRPYAWDGVALSLDMAVLRATRWEAVKRKRAEIIDGGILVEGIGPFDTDEPARANVSGAAIAALAAIALHMPFEAGWTLRDNSRATLTAQQMVTVHMTGVGFIGAVHGHAASLREQIEAAPTIEALDAIDIESGWPSNGSEGNG